MIGTATFRVTFERIGRRREVPHLDIELTNPHDAEVPIVIVDKVFDYVKRYLGSKECDVDIYGHPLSPRDSDEGCEILLEGGRFGRATVEVVQ
jgi:hypothetical protein